MDATKFTVTRQLQYPDGDFVVEISQGEFDYCNPGKLGCMFRKLGEDETFAGMTPAVEAGIAIAKAWQEHEPDLVILIAVGNTGGNTMPFDGEEFTEEVLSALREKAKAFDEKLPKCSHCGEILPAKKDRYRNGNSDWSGDEFCSMHCAEEAQRFDDQQQAEDDAEADAELAELTDGDG